jgi:hypothetical protein
MGVIDDHKAKWAKKPAAAAVTVPIAGPVEPKTREYEVLKQLVHADYQRLKNTPDDGTRHKAQKARLLNNYREYLAGVMAADERQNNDVLFFNVVWAADVGEWAWLLTLTDFAVATGQTNTIFKSNAESIACREIYYQADRMNKDGVEPMPAFFAAFEKVKQKVWQIPTAVEAKFFKLAGIVAHAKGDLQTACDYYQVADDIYPNVAVKGRLKEVKELLMSPSTGSPSA